MTATDIAAWVGAVTGVGALAWDFFKWKHQGAQLRVEVQPNQTFLSVDSQGRRLGESGEKRISVTVVNIGDRPTLITGLLGELYTRRFFRKVDLRGMFVIPLLTPYTQKLPHELGPGQRWIGFINQAELEADREKGTTIKLGVGHTASTKAAMALLKFT